MSPRNVASPATSPIAHPRRSRLPGENTTPTTATGMLPSMMRTKPHTRGAFHRQTCLLNTRPRWSHRSRDRNSIERDSNGVRGPGYLTAARGGRCSVRDDSAGQGRVDRADCAGEVPSVQSTLNALELNAAFAEEVAAPLTADGWQQENLTTMWRLVGDALTVVKRIERHHTPPAEYAFGFRHTFLRDVNGEDDDGVPPAITSYPVRCGATSIDSIPSRAWRYAGFNMKPHVGPAPREGQSWAEWYVEFRAHEADVLDYAKVESTEVISYFRKLRDELAEHTERVVTALTPERMLKELERRSSGTWVESLWVEDYRRHLGLSPRT